MIDESEVRNINQSLLRRVVRLSLKRVVPGMRLQQRRRTTNFTFTIIQANTRQKMVTLTKNRLVDKLQPTHKVRAASKLKIFPSHFRVSWIATLSLALGSFCGFSFLFQFSKRYSDVKECYNLFGCPWFALLHEIDPCFVLDDSVLAL